MATILQLLQALNRGELPNLPPPARPLPLGPIQPPNVPAPYFGAEPELPPVAPLPALDTAFIRNYAGQEPVRPTIQPPSTLDKIAAVLGGIGYGPQYGMALREERERPMREYEAKRERYEQRRTAGLEIAERKQERQQEQATRRAMAQADREFELYKQRSGITDKLALQQLDQAHEMAKLREAERIADEKLQAQQRAQQERDARLIARDYGKLTDNPKIALELGRYYAGLTDKLSPEAAKFESVQNKLAEARALRLARIAAGGFPPADKLMAVLENGQIVPASLVNREKGYVALGGAPVKVVNYVGGGVAQAQAQQPAAPQPPSSFLPEFSLTEGLGSPQVKPTLNKQQRARFNDIKRDQPNASDEKILNYMRLKGWY